jgi:hypothetical protein
MRHGDWRKKRKHFEYDDLPTGKDEAFFKRMCLLWERDCDEYTGEIDEWYEPANGEILIHGHSVTTREKSALNRGFSPGKVWDMGTSVNIDCGLGNRLSDHDKIAVKYGNLAAYNMDTGEVEFLYDIPDDYPSLKEEYADEKREMLETEEKERKAKDLMLKSKVEPLRKSFFDNITHFKEDDPNLAFNFLKDNFCLQLSMPESKSFKDFDPEKDLPMAYAGNIRKGTLYIHNAQAWRKWAEIPLTLDHYRLIKLGGRPALFGMSGKFGQNAEVSIDDAFSGGNVMRYKIRVPHYTDFRTVIKGNDKFEKIEYVQSPENKENKENPENKSKRRSPNGLATCDFFFNTALYTMRVIKNPDDIIIAQLMDSSGNIIEEFIRSGSRQWNKG